MRIIDFFDKGVALARERACLIDDTVTRTYGEVQARTHRIANGVRRAGIAPGSKAAVYSGNAAVAFEVILGFSRAGCTWTTVNARNLVPDTIYVLNNTETDVLFYSRAFGAQVEEILAGCPRIRHVICIDGRSDRHPCLEDWIDGLPDISEEVRRGPDDFELMLSSGGTTGKPKGVPMTQLNWEIMTGATNHFLYGRDPVHLVVGPMTHAAGTIAMMLMPMGATHVILPGFDPLRVMQAIEKHRVTHLFLPPTAIYMLLAHPDVRNHDYSSLRHFLYASSPMAVDKLKEAMAVFGPVLAQSYAQTETGAKMTYFSAAEHVRAVEAGDDRRLQSCGRPALFARIEIMDDDGNILPSETPGEIVVRSHSVTPCYYNDPEETERARRFGWHHTGDIGVKDAEGYLYIVDRKKDMVISGGFNIYPAEIEKVILGHADVQDCAVIGVPDEKWGEALKAIVQLKPGAAFDEDALKAFCRRSLSGYKVPKSFEAWPEIPKTAVGKTLKRSIRERYWQGRGRNV